MKKLLRSVTLALCLVIFGQLHAQTTTLTSPTGSVSFGYSITVLPNGNFVITDPSWANGSIANVGAVYLYNGATYALISTLTGSNANDYVGIDGITVLNNGNYVIRNSKWSGNKGAVTWANCTAGVSGT